MRKVLIFLLLAASHGMMGQSALSFGSDLPDDTIRTDTFPISSKEEFVNQVFRAIVDSSFSSYYLFEEAPVCRFVKFNYDEWAKYGLGEPLSIVVLNELAEKCYRDTTPSVWRQALLVKAYCMDFHKADSITHPDVSLSYSQVKSGRKYKKALRRKE